MRKIGKIAIAALAMVGAGQVVCWANCLVVHALVACGRWEPEAAAKVAPWVLVALASGLAFSLHEMRMENHQSSHYGCVERTETWNAKNSNNRKVV